ncbi:hypothetical protein ABPG75_000061 [Micractinium tetrahymenae]
MLEGAKQHSGIAQYLQPHILLAGGLQAIDGLLPGFHQELVRRGGVEVDMLKDVRMFTLGAPLAHGESSIKVVLASRHVYQSTIQDEVLSRKAPWLDARDSTRVTGLTWSDDKSCVTGVKLGNGEELPADLVIVAAGRTPRLPQWLKAAGYEEPPVCKVDPHAAYTATFCRCENGPQGWKSCSTFDRTGGLHGAHMVPIEQNLYQVNAFGSHDTVPPADKEGFMAFLRELPDQEIYEAMLKAELVTPLKKYSVAPAFRRHWNKIPMPKGVVAIGDQVQGVNPIFGQGIAAAAQSVVTLNESFSEAVAYAGDNQDARRAALHGLGPAFHKRLLEVLELPWLSSTAEDRKHPSTKMEGEVSAPPGWLNAYMDAVTEACQHDTKANEVLLGLFHLLRPPTHFFHPRLLAGVAQHSLRKASRSPSALRSSGRTAGRTSARATPALSAKGLSLVRF